MHIDDILKIAVAMDASDVHLKAGGRPLVRVNGLLLPLEPFPPLTPKDTEALAAQIMNEFQQKKFREILDLDLAYSLAGYGRFRATCSTNGGRSPSRSGASPSTSSPSASCTCLKSSRRSPNTSAA